MMELDEILASLLEGVDGAVSAAVAGMDGLLVEQYPPDAADLTNVAAELANVLSYAAGVSPGLAGGELQELMLRYEERSVYVRFLASDLYCLVVLGEKGNFGKARLCAKQAAGNFEQVLS